MRISKSIISLACFALLASCQSSQVLTEIANEDATGRKRNVIAGPLKPFKDNLFAYRQALEIRDEGDFLRAPYNEQKDINQRDEQPVRKVRSSYIKSIAKERIFDLTYPSNGRELSTYAVGKINGGSKITVVYLHGKNGGREWGFDDEKFGGNYNRLKNLMLDNDGAYFSPNFSDFEDKGKQDIVALLTKQKSVSAGPVILACGSLGSNICWAIANDKATQNLIDGMVMLGGFINDAYLTKGAAMPIYFAHGSRDKTSPALRVESLYSQLKTKGYPVRMTLFESGNHGTPVRMIDWRQALNWIASKQ